MDGRLRKRQKRAQIEEAHREEDVRTEKEDEEAAWGGDEGEEEDDDDPEWGSGGRPLRAKTSASIV